MIAFAGETLLAALWVAVAIRATRDAHRVVRIGAFAFAILASYSLALFGDAQTSSLADVLRLCMLVIAYPLVFAAIIPAGAALWWAPERLARALGSPLVAAFATPVVLAVYCFTPLWPAVVGHTAVLILSYPALFIVGLLLHAGLKGSGHATSAIAIALQAMLSLGELVIDAVPGIVMRLSTGVIGASHWSQFPHALDNQSIAGAFLWAIADVSDLPIIALVFVRWMRADAEEARRVDAMLDAMEE